MQQWLSFLLWINLIYYKSNPDFVHPEISHDHKFMQSNFFSNNRYEQCDVYQCQIHVQVIKKTYLLFPSIFHFFEGSSSSLCYKNFWTIYAKSIEEVADWLMESVIHCFLFCYVNCFCYTFLLMFCWVSVKKWKKLLKIDSFFLYLSGSCINIFWTKNG